MLNNKKAFTLIELIVVVAILALLATVAVPMISGWVGKAEENTAKENARTIELALKAYMAEEGLDGLYHLNHVFAKAAFKKYGIAIVDHSQVSLVPVPYTHYKIEGSKWDFLYSDKGQVTIVPGDGKIKYNGEFPREGPDDFPVKPPIKDPPGELPGKERPGDGLPTIDLDPDKGPPRP